MIFADAKMRVDKHENSTLVGASDSCISSAKNKSGFFSSLTVRHIPSLHTHPLPAPLEHSVNDLLRSCLRVSSIESRPRSTRERLRKPEMVDAHAIREL